MVKAIKMSAAVALIVLSKSGVDPEDMSDEALEQAFNEAKAAQNTEDDAIDPEQPIPTDTEPLEEVVPVEDSGLEVDPELVEDSPVVEDVVDDAAPVDAVIASDPAPVEESKITYEDEYFKLVDGKVEFQPLKINGEEIPIENMQELYSLGSKGGHFTQSMQEIAPYRRSISAMKENNLTEADINLLIEARSGNKDAMSALMQSSGIDPIDVEDKPAEGYVTKQYGQSQQQMDIQDIQRDLGKDPEFAMTTSVIDDQWDPASRAKLAEDPKMIRGLHEDIKSGVYQQVAPQASKLAVMDGHRKSKLDYYIEAGAQYFAIQDAEHQRRATPAAPAQPTNSREKRSAANPGGNATKKPDVIDYLNMSDNDYDKMYDKIMSRV